MKVKIHRGTKEIGGTCVEIIANNGKVLWVDLGAPLDGSNPDVNYASGNVDALLISHPHQDHYGLMEKTDPSTPIYIGEVALDFINATRLFTDKPILNGNHIHIKPWKKFTILDTFAVKGYMTDHSTPESFAFQIDVDGKRLYYSGDFRATGRKEFLFKRTLEKPPREIDVLLMEGTMIERVNHKYQSEESVEEGIYEVVKDQQNISCVVSSAQNIDRFVSIYRACKKLNKKVVIDVYTAWLLEKLSKHSPNIPTASWDEVLVYCKPHQMDKILGNEYDSFREFVENNSVGNRAFNNPSELVYFERNPNRGFHRQLYHHGPINIIYSQWEGYLKEEYKQPFTDNINSFKDDPNYTFQTIHTSGHASIQDLILFAKAIDAKEVFPIHTEYPKKFMELFEANGISTVKSIEDGIAYELK